MGGSSRSYTNGVCGGNPVDHGSYITCDCMLANLHSVVNQIYSTFDIQLYMKCTLAG